MDEVLKAIFHGKRVLSDVYLFQMSFKIYLGMSQSKWTLIFVVISTNFIALNASDELLPAIEALSKKAPVSFKIASIDK